MSIASTYTVWKVFKFSRQVYHC